MCVCVFFFWGGVIVLYVFNVFLLVAFLFWWDQDMFLLGGWVGLECNLMIALF